MMLEPTVYMQLGISEERFEGIVTREVSSILKTRETIGNMMMMVQDNTKLDNSEKLYAAFVVSKEYQMRKLIGAMPAIGKGMITKILED